MIIKKLALLAFGMLIGILSSCTEPNPFNSKVSRNIFLVDYIDLPGPQSIIPGKLCRWRNQDCLIRWNQIFQVDAKNLKVNLLPLPEEFEPIMRLEMSQDKRLMGVSWKKTGSFLFIENGDSWKKISLPINVKQDEASSLFFTVKGDKAVFKFVEKIFFWDGKEWLNKPYPFDPRNFYPYKVLIAEDELYLAVNNGSFHGGALAKLNIGTNKFVILDEETVNDIGFDNSGKLWCSSNGLFDGLLSLENNKLVGQCGIDNHARTGTGITTTRKAVNWPLETAYFPSMTVCEDDSILLGTPSQGIFKYKDHKTKKLASAWNKGYDLDSILQLENGKIAFTAFGEGLGVIKENYLPRSVLLKRN